MRNRLAIAVCMSAALSSIAWASSLAIERSPLKPEPNSLFFRAIDTGSGTATLTIVTGASANDRTVMIYDGGHWNDDSLIREELKHYLGRRRMIDLLIISHSDSDHLGAADTILNEWTVKKGVRTGWERHDMNRTGPKKGSYWVYRDALAKSVRDKGTEDFVIGSGSPAHGESWDLGDARLTFLSGFASLPSGWNVGVPPSHSKFESKARNGVSIVVRVDYAGRAILLPGDAVGRLDDQPWSQILGTEKFLLDNKSQRQIRADVLLVPHHGADNASSLPFIQEVAPSWVLFSSGVEHSHPKFNTFRRYESIGIAAERMLRTDRGDQKGRPTEWSGNWDGSCRDVHGDDGISILIRKTNGAIVVDQDPAADPQKGC